MTEGRKQAYLEADRHRKRKSNKKSNVQLKEAMRSAEILDGTYPVPELRDTDDSIGTMSVVCQHCGALKFSRESPGSCCQGSKVAVCPFPKPPEQLINLWTGNTTEAELF